MYKNCTMETLGAVRIVMIKNNFTPTLTSALASRHDQRHFGKFSRMADTQGFWHCRFKSACKQYNRTIHCQFARLVARRRKGNLANIAGVTRLEIVSVSQLFDKHVPVPLDFICVQPKSPYKLSDIALHLSISLRMIGLHRFLNPR